MVALIRILPEFAYDRDRGKFRNFLLTIVHRKSLAMLKRTARNSEVPWDELRDGLADVFDNVKSLHAEVHARWRDSLLEEAIRSVQRDERLEKATWEIFEAYAIQRQPAREVALKFGEKENAVYQIRNRLLRRIQAEVIMLKRNSRSD